MSKRERNITITNTTKGTPTPVGVPFESIKNTILGLKYNLSLVFIEPSASKKLNKLYRNKSYAANILSFPLSKNEGEIFITPAVVKADAVKFNLGYKKFMGLLVIHGCLHLKGLQHSSKMEKAEEKYFKKFFN
ncbi:MAG: putative rRNA maturation factor [Candidatus Nomurabacteria bacterium GW2011_GWB1_37_5]|uniref:Endoribonuclease YbeY n=1 Tax=Candidatus Nomurabacteria bacterium GW2011_GWB1_37_5 TaxID=1618742 RepID=A0A0G0JFG1_9BACT|nr:MAG: putative rRNA maturation factor [Candidatus Nomurabacteria bacterium GW2011_GWB1_37_5]